MKELERYEGLTAGTRKLGDGWLTTLKTGVGFSGGKSIDHAGKTLLATKVYKENESNDVIYALIGANGEAEGFFHEREGIMPMLFKNPQGAPFASVQPYHPDKDLEISLPLFGREPFETPKPGRPFLGDYVGTTGAFAVLHDADIWSDKKPDKLLWIEFSGGKIKKKHHVKLDLPRDNKACADDEGIHLMARDGDVFVHRLLDEKGKEKKVRRIASGGHWFRQVLSLSFEKDSLLITSEEGRIRLLTVTPAGEVRARDLCDVGFEIYNMYGAARLSEDCFAALFNGESGNGWFVVEGGELKEAFVGTDAPGFRELRSGVLLDPGRNDLVLDSINRTDGGYAIVLEPTTGAEDHSVLFVLNRMMARREAGIPR
jgi:hypothetical protein